MAIKHQLQHSIFNGVSNLTGVSDLAVTLSYLQTLAGILQKLKVEKRMI